MKFTLINNKLNIQPVPTKHWVERRWLEIAEGAKSKFTSITNTRAYSTWTEDDDLLNDVQDETKSLMRR